MFFQKYFKKIVTCSSSIFFHRNASSYTVIKQQIQFTKSFDQALLNRLVNRKKDDFLRLEILAGQGCEGFTYKFKFDAILKESDFVRKINLLDQERIVFAVNGDEVKLLNGSTLDFAQEMMKEVFYVKENPNAEISCSCKTSFSPKDFVI